MSCQHVLSPALENSATRIASGARVSPIVLPDPTRHLRRVATTREYGGRIRADGLPSFDVQLAEVQDREWLKRALSEVGLSRRQPFVPDRAALEKLAESHNFEILVPQNHPEFAGERRISIGARLRGFVSNTLDLTYTFADGSLVPIYHLLLAELRIGEGSATLPGDSGSPVIARDADGSCILVGMHISRDLQTNCTYAIPAWQLFDPVNYWTLPLGASLRPVNP